MARSRGRERRTQSNKVKRGQAPGTPAYAGAPREAAIAMRVTHYTEEGIEHFDAFGDDVIDRGRSPDGITWIDLDGIHDAQKVQAVATTFDVHPLWVEDLLNPTARPKAETLGEGLLAIVRMVRVVDDALNIEHIGLVCGPAWVLSFQERPGDVWDNVRTRIERGARIRRMGSAYLFHALLDAIVDEYFVAVEYLDVHIDELEALALGEAPSDLAQRVHALRAEIGAFRNATRPFREAVAQLSRGDVELIDEATLPFYRDLYDHILQVMELTEGARDRLSGVLELHLALTSHQLNVVMRVLTVVSTVFIPITFIAGVYGMNFQNMPELAWPGAYGVVLGVMAAIAIGLVLWFRRMGWLD